MQVARDAAFRDMVDEKVQSASTYVSPDLAPGLYHGRVLAEAKDGFQSDYSPVVSWEQKEAPVMEGMESSTEAPPVLQWSAMGPGWLYELQAAKARPWRAARRSPLTRMRGRRAADRWAGRAPSSA